MPFSVRQSWIVHLRAYFTLLLVAFRSFVVLRTFDIVPFLSEKGKMVSQLLIGCLLYLKGFIRCYNSPVVALYGNLACCATVFSLAVNVPRYIRRL